MLFRHFYSFHQQDFHFAPALNSSDNQQLFREIPKVRLYDPFQLTPRYQQHRQLLLRFLAISSSPENRLKKHPSCRPPSLNSAVRRCDRLYLAQHLRPRFVHPIWQPKQLAMQMLLFYPPQYRCFVFLRGFPFMEH